MCDRNRWTFLDVSDINKDDSAYTNTDDEGVDVDDNESDLLPGSDDPSAPTGVTGSDIRNLKQNAVLNNEDDGEENYSEVKESDTDSDNRSGKIGHNKNNNDHQNDHGN